MNINRKARLIFVVLLLLELLGCARLDAAIHLNHSAELINTGEYKSAISEATQAIAIKPDYHLAYIDRGLAYTLAREYDNARADYIYAIALKPEEAVAYLNYANLLYYLRKTPEAIEVTQKFLRIHPKSMLMKIGLAGAYEAQDKNNEAYDLTSDVLSKLEISGIEDVEELKYIIKDNFFTHVYGLHAVVAAALHKNNEASNSIAKAKTYRNDLTTHYYMAKIYYIKGNWQQSVNELKNGYIQATKEQLDSPLGFESSFLLGNSYFKMGDMQKAIEAYEHFLSANKFDKKAFLNLGLAYEKLGYNRSAIDNYTSAFNLDNNLLEALTYRGSIYNKKKQYSDAISDFSTVLDQQPRNTDALLGRAYAQCMNGNRSMAKNDLVAVLTIEPGNNQAKKALTECGNR